MNRFQDCTLAIIAGGQARRLNGIVKVQLRLPDGRTILQRTLDELGPLVDEVIVSTSHPAPFAPLRCVPDLIADRGAPGGVHAACAAARTEWVLAVGSDLPFVTAEVLAILWNRRDGADVVFTGRSEDHPEPLLAFYRARQCASAFGQALRDGGASFSSLFASNRTVFVPAGELLGVDPSLDSFENVNTPDDVARLGLGWPENDSTRKLT